jgi:hypothetical protein
LRQQEQPKKKSGIKSGMRVNVTPLGHPEAKKYFNLVNNISKTMENNDSKLALLRKDLNI